MNVLNQFYVYKCCDKSFADPFNLKQHQLSHQLPKIAFKYKFNAEPEMSFNLKCHCGAAFSTKRGLSQHQRVHNKIKCTTCNQSFSTKQKLKVHNSEHLYWNNIMMR